MTLIHAFQEELVIEARLQCVKGDWEVRKRLCLHTALSSVSSHNHFLCISNLAFCICVLLFYYKDTYPWI